MVLSALGFKCQACEGEIGVYGGSHVTEGHNLNERSLKLSSVPINSTFETMVVSILLKKILYARGSFFSCLKKIQSISI